MSGISGRYTIVIIVWHLKSQSEDRMLNHSHADGHETSKGNHQEANIPSHMK